MKDIPQCNERKYIMKLTHLGVEENTNVLKTQCECSGSLPLCTRRALMTLESARFASWDCCKGLKLSFRSFLKIEMYLW